MFIQSSRYPLMHVLTHQPHLLLPSSVPPLTAEAPNPAMYYVDLRVVRYSETADKRTDGRCISCNRLSAYLAPGPAAHCRTAHFSTFCRENLTTTCALIRFYYMHYASVDPPDDKYRATTLARNVRHYEAFKRRNERLLESYFPEMAVEWKKWTRASNKKNRRVLDGESG